jgi:hypothetical protein
MFGRVNRDNMGWYARVWYAAHCGRITRYLLDVRLPPIFFPDTSPVLTTVPPTFLPTAEQRRTTSFTLACTFCLLKKFPAQDLASAPRPASHGRDGSRRARQSQAARRGALFHHRLLRAGSRETHGRLLRAGRHELHLDMLHPDHTSCSTPVEAGGRTG